ncbi:MAG: trypsin-like peptidase domain-containing protein [Acidobacteriota bacterium]
MQSPDITPSRFARLQHKVRSGHLTSVFTLLAVLSIGILAGSLFTGRVSANGQQINSSDAHQLTIPDPKNLSNAFTLIAKNVGPAVVNINTEQLPKASKGKKGQPAPDADGGDDQNDQSNDMQNFLHKFFGGQGGGDEAPDSGPSRALGSGFIVDTNGYIITNNHVVDKADHIYVKLSTDPEDDADPGRPATVIGVDKDTDIAVIKIDPKGAVLPTVKLGNSDGAQVGDWVLAIGSPFGLNQTVSAGIVSAKNRTIDEAGANGVSQSQFQKFIQTDAAINPGNSGGPLVAMDGEVVGMNTAIYTQSMGSEGVGFAMPSNTIINVYNMLISPQHKVTRGSIGITFQAAQSSAVSRMYNFSNGGVLVSSVVPDGPAAKAGIQPQDVILTIDGKNVKNGDELVAIVSAKAPGGTVRVGFLRDGKHQDATVGIVDRAKLYANLGMVPTDTAKPQESDAGENKLGIKVQSITPAIASKLGVKGGVAVTSVRPGSFADEINLTKGVIITEINRHSIASDSDYRNIVGSLKSGDDVVFVLRDPRSPTAGNAIVGGTLP